MKIKSLGLKISLIVTLMISIIIFLIMSVVTTRVELLVQEFTHDKAKIANTTLLKSMENYQKEALNRAILIASDSEVAAAIVANDVERLSEVLQPYRQGIDLITIVDSVGDVILRVHNDKRGDNLFNQKALSTSLTTGEGVALIERGNTVGLTTAGTIAMKDSDGNIYAAVKCGHDLSHEEFVDEIKMNSDCEVTIFDGDTRINTTFIDEKGERAIGTQASDEVIETVINQRKEFSSVISLFGHNYVVSYSPLIINNEVIGMLFSGVNTEDLQAKQQDLIKQIALLAIGMGFLSVLSVFLVCTFMISKPMKKIKTFAEQIKTGQLGISSASHDKIDVQSSDEIGSLSRTLEQAFGYLKGYIIEIKDRMSGLSNGDFATMSTYEFQGDYTLIKDSINQIIDNLNQTMIEINSASEQVTIGAQQIADGAQNLAQGSTEQASAIEELSASIVAINGMAKENSEIATTVLNEVQEAGRLMGGCTEQMNQMLAAMVTIDEKSKDIFKTTKVIDDIAFQTNILALNAAVEAARAGQHGKGFAVVAEEVRNLASKSAEAARETAILLESSLRSVEEGNTIVEKVNDSLQLVADFVHKNAEKTASIQTNSVSQSCSMEQITIGVEQVAQVVQQNSATSEESAAASEEMRSQSASLQELIASFKLKNGSEPSKDTFTAGRSENNKESTPVPSSPPNKKSGMLKWPQNAFGKY